MTFVSDEICRWSIVCLSQAAFEENVVLVANPSRSGGDWWHGTLVGSGKSGLFPKTFVQVVEPGEQSATDLLKNGLSMMYKSPRKPCTIILAAVQMNYSLQKVKSYQS
jgi:hypothetical protein